MIRSFYFIFFFTVFSEVLISVNSFTFGVFSPDKYQFVEATREFYLNGFPKITYWPNSNAGLDIFYWTHFLQPLIYTFFSSLHKFNYSNFEILKLFELFLVFFSVFFFIKKIFPKKIIFLVFLLITLDSIFNTIFFTIQYQRLVIPVTFCALTILFFLVSKREKNNFYFYIFLYGLLTSLNPLIFVSIGIPIFLSLLFCFFYFLFIKWKELKSRYFYILIFSFSLLLPYLIFYYFFSKEFHLFNFFESFVSGKNYFLDSFFTVFIHKINQLGYFFSTILISPYGISLMPIGILANILNLFLYKKFDYNRRIILISSILILTWFLCAFLSTSHFYAGRLIWILPLLIFQIFIFLNNCKNEKNLISIFFQVSFIILFFQIIYHLSFGGINPHALFFFIVFLVISIMFLVLCRKKNIFFHKFFFNLNINKSSFIIFLIIITPQLFQYINVTFKNLNNLILNKNFGFKETKFDKYTNLSKEFFSRSLNNDILVLTNYPMKELFPDTIKIQSIQKYRGLLGGALSFPADKIILFNYNFQTIYNDMKTFNVYYRGYKYEINERKNLGENFKVHIGDPTNNNTSSIVDVNLDTISKEEYINFMKSKKKYDN